MGQMDTLLSDKEELFLVYKKQLCSWLLDVEKITKDEGYCKVKSQDGSK